MKDLKEALVTTHPQIVTATPAGRASVGTRHMFSSVRRACWLETQQLSTFAAGVSWRHTTVTQRARPIGWAFRDAATTAGRGWCTYRRLHATRLMASILLIDTGTEGEARRHETSNDAHVFCRSTRRSEHVRDRDCVTTRLRHQGRSNLRTTAAASCNRAPVLRLPRVVWAIPSHRK